MIKEQPFVVEVTRGDRVESRHRVDAVVADAAGTVIHAWGDPTMEIYPRSSLKPLQALALLETGAAEKFGLTDAEIALACASHSGEPVHVRAVGDWLSRLHRGADDLECGAHWPYSDEATRDMARHGETPTRVHNNCSGKHAGFLTTALHLGEETRGYLDIDHPVQKRLYDLTREMGDCDLSETGRGIDGCGIPVYGMPLVALALGMARMADPKGLSPARKSAAERIVAAMAGYPALVGGAGRFDTAAMSAGHGGFACKGGAEGMHAAIVPGLGLGIAVKVEDGEGRASEVALAGLLDFVGALDGEARSGLAAYLERPIRNAAGDLVGHIRPHAGWCE